MYGKRDMEGEQGVRQNHNQRNEELSKISSMSYYTFSARVEREKKVGQTE